MKLRLGFVLLILVVPTIAASEDRTLDTARSTIRIHVGKAGVFSAAGHEHWVAAPLADGKLDEATPASISFRVEAAKLKVEEDKTLSAEKQAEVQRTMQTQVLESEKYPEISFHSTSVQKTGPDAWQVRGDLKLHGQTHGVATAVHKQQDAYVGKCELKQTDFGIQPIRVGGGVVKVKDQLDIEFSIVPGQ
ncbi:MAG: YceI family protein [Acidobacteriaceae bacterium]|nr:YceI family protein [Acidobacteriaceae bacterium]